MANLAVRLEYDRKYDNNKGSGHHEDVWGGDSPGIHPGEIASHNMRSSRMNDQSPNLARGQTDMDGAESKKWVLLLAGISGMVFLAAVAGGLVLSLFSETLPIFALALATIAAFGFFVAGVGGRASS